MRNAELLIFDLDGTLIDSKRDLANSVNATRAWMGMGPLALDLVSTYVGNGAPMLVKRALPGASDQELALALRYFLDYYREHMLDETTVYPGVREALDEMHDAGKSLAVLTNKPVRFSVTLLEGLNLDLHFFRIYGGNSFDEKKPHPAGIRALMKERHIEPHRTVMVGDSSVDILTARNAGTLACGVNWGFQPETFADVPPDLRIDDLRELSRLVGERS
ncbi:MAG: HAD-IIIA family hydrolase [Acidobacteriota bacterium]